MTYPYSLAGWRLITLPTACTTSTIDLRGSMKTTPSKAGTSTPSDRHLALESMRHRRGSVLLSPSHRSCFLRSSARVLPSTCRTSTSLVVGLLSFTRATTPLKLSAVEVSDGRPSSRSPANRLDAFIVLEKTITRCSRRSVWSSS